MIVERSMHPQWLSNTYLVAREPGAAAFFVDAGGPLAPLLARADQMDADVTHIFVTHHHHDHIAELETLRGRWPAAEVCAHPAEVASIPGTVEPLEPGSALTVGGLRVEVLHTPGHTAGMVALLVDGAVFTGDTIFKGSVGGVRAPGHTTYADLRHSIMDVLLALDPQTVIHPGHMEASTVAEELEHNAFVRIWRGLDPEQSEPCRALGQPATLVLLGNDYDGGHKAWVRWPDGSDDIVPGSQVERGAT